MELRVLRYFLAVAREESFSKAADFLHITQPTLSRQLMELEEELGAALLVRGKRGRSVALTEEGRLLRKRAEEIVELADRAEAEFHSPCELICGEVCIGAGETDAMRLVARVATALRQKCPEVRYHLFSGNADDVKERLDKGLLDFGVLIEPAEIEKYDYLRFPAVDTWGVLMRRDNPLAKKAAIRPEDLCGLPLLVSRQTLVRNAFSGWLGHSLETLPIVATYNLIYNASLMVDEGMGCALTLGGLVNTTGSSLCFCPLEPRLEASLSLVWKKRTVLSKAAAEFLRRFQREFLR